MIPNNKPRRCGIVGVAVKKGQTKNGTQVAPEAFRKAGLLDRLRNLGHEVTDYGDLHDVEVPESEQETRWFHARHPVSVGSTGKIVAETVLNAMKQNDLVISLGGDHSMAFGTFQAHLKNNPDACLIWVDAHADLNLPFTTPSGSMHGMPVGLHIKELSSAIEMPEYFQWFDQRISAKNVAYLALRDIDDDERRIIKHLGIPAYSMHDIDKHGIAYCLKKAVEAINPNMDKTIHLSFDIDAIDPTDCPSTGTPVPGGLSIREGLYICEELYRTGLLRTVDLAEVNPCLGSEDDVRKTLITAMLLLETCAGDVRDLSVKPQHWLSKIQPQSSEQDSERRKSQAIA